MARRKRRSFTPEYKAEAVRLVQVGDRSVREVAKALALAHDHPKLRPYQKDANAALERAIAVARSHARAQDRPVRSIDILLRHLGPCAPRPHQASATRAA